MKNLERKWLAGFVFLGFLAAWSVAAYLLRPESGKLVLFPGPLVVVGAFYRMLTQENFISDIAVSSMRVGLGVFAATIPASVLGLLFGTNPRLHGAITPLFAFVKYIPPVSFVPVLILWFGIGLKQQIALLFIGIFFYLTIMIADTVAGTPQAYKDAALTLGINNRQMILKVITPNALPSFFEHLRVMVGIAWTYLVVAEMVAAPSGIGRVIINSQRYLQTDRVLAGMLTIGLLGIVFDSVLRMTSRVVCKGRV